jgi:hypothetical protein
VSFITQEAQKGDFPFVIYHFPLLSPDGRRCIAKTTPGKASPDCRAMMTNEKWSMTNDKWKILVSFSPPPSGFRSHSFAPGLTFSYTSILPFCGLMITRVTGVSKVATCSFS